MKARVFFEHVPARPFRTRMLLPSVFVFVLGFFSVGLLADDPWIVGKEQARKLAQIEEHAPAATLAFRHYGQTATLLFNIPDACWTGNTVNDLQKSRCDEFWEKTLKLVVLASFPFILVGIFLRIVATSAGSIYDRMRTKIKQGRALVKGTVTDPAELEQDWYAWTFCLRSVSVNVAGKKQLRVYLPLDEPCPRPGTVLAVFETHEFGQKRYFGATYQPHVVVFQAA